MEEDSDDDKPTWRASIANLARGFIPELNFITIHYLYFILTSLLTGLIFWGSSTPFKSVSFTDSFFLCASAMTEAGLNTINLSTLNTWQQIILFLLIMMGSAIFVSIFTVHVRLRAFEREFRRAIVAKRDERKRTKAQAREPFPRARAGSHSNASGIFDASETIEKAPSGSQVPNGTEANAQADVVGEVASSTDWFTEKDSGPLGDEHGKSTGHEADVDLSLSLDGVHHRGRALDRSIRFEVSPLPLGRQSNFADMHSPIERTGTGHSHSSRNAGNRPEHMRPSFFSFTGVGATASSSLHPRSPTPRGPTFESLGSPSPAGRSIEHSTNPWFQSAAGYFTRNSQVYGLTFEERQELGGREYYAILFLSFLVPIYFFLWQFLGALALGAWINQHRASIARENGIDPWWLGAFNAVSAFNNSGMSLLDANVTAFQDCVFLLISMGLFILAGNTAYPIFLRLAIWSLWKMTPDGAYWSHEKETLRFLLDHPRRCYTNLFPGQHTWWLGLTLIVLNGMDWAFFEILNIGNKAITELSAGYEVLDGLFQALAVRSGGFYVVPIASTRISLQVLYVIMMYISAYPVAITIRNSNVYEERSLGIFSEDAQPEEEQAPRGQAAGRSTKSPGVLERPLSSAGPFTQLKRSFTLAAQARSRERASTFVRQQVRAQLSHDAWWLALAVFLIMIIEGGSFEQNEVVFSVFNVIFEVVSGYACCGISVGVPYAAYSFCGAWHTLSKLIMIAVMIRGRHRGLPVAIDQAVQLPGTRNWAAEEEDARLRFERSFTVTEGQA